MKKNFLFKGVAMLGAISLLANTTLPGLQVYAGSDVTPVHLGNVTNDDLSSETYNFISYSSDGETQYGTGKVKVLNKGTVVNVVENYKVDDENGFKNKKFVVKSTEFVDGGEYDLYEEDGKNQETNRIKVKISNENKGESETTYDFESYKDTTKWGNGTVKVLNQGTVVKVIKNFEADTATFSGESFYVSGDNSNGLLKLYTSAGETPVATSPEIYVKLIGECTKNSETCDFESYGDENGTNLWGIGKVKIESEENLADQWTKVKVIENFMVTEQAKSFENKEYVVKATSYENGKRYGLYNAANDVTTPSIWVEITGKKTDNDKTIYSFKSYSAETDGDLWGAGEVEVVNSYTTVNVEENYAKDSLFENQKFVVYATENEGTKYSLYKIDNGAKAGIYVEILSGDNENGYSFVSYDDENGTNKRGNGKVSFVEGFTKVEVTENSVNGFVGNKYVIYATELANPNTLYPLYNVDGNAANISVKISAFTVKFQTNGGKETITDQVVAEGAKIEKPTDPTKDGYTFDKWYSDEALTKEWNFDSDTVNENVTLYAKWNQNQSSSSSSSSSSSRSSGGGGGSSKSTTKTTETKANTGDTAKVDNAKTDNKVTDNNTNDNTKTPAYNDKYSKEFNDAYQFAYKNGITTMPSIEEADMEGTLTRIAMAKMLSQYAINVLGKTPDTTKVVPTFPDVTAQMDADYNNGVTLAYQLGIMGIGIDKFRPDDLVTRAEFATALSRLLFNTPDGEGAYYETHLAKLMEEKIITNNNPDLQELRGYVMIMLMRSAQS